MAFSLPKFIFTSNAKLSTIAKKKGQILIVKDTKKLYVDIDDSSRLGISDQAVTNAKNEVLKGGTMTGDLVFNKVIKVNDGVHTRGIINVYDDGDGNTNYGSEMVIEAGGNTFVGSGESASQLRDALQAGITTGELYGQSNERLYLSSDNELYFYAGAQTIANRKGIVFDGAGNLKPLANNTNTLGSASVRWNAIYGTHINLTGTITTSIMTSSFSNGNKGTNVIINSTAAANSYVMLAKMNSTNGVFTHGVFQTKYVLQYTDKTTASSTTNAVTKSAILLDESGNSQFPGTVKVDRLNILSAGDTDDSENPAGLIIGPATGHRIEIDDCDIQAYSNGNTCTDLYINNYGGNIQIGSQNTTNTTFNGNIIAKDVARFVTCTTAAGTVAKIVTLNNFHLYNGAQILIKFTNNNTAANPTLNVNNTGAKPIYYKGAAIGNGYIFSNQTYHLIYNGTQYEIVGDVNTGPISFSIATSAWSSVSTSGYSYRASITNATIKSTDSPDVRFALASIATCQTAQVAPACESYNGGIYIYAKTKPAATVSGVYLIEKG